MPTKCIDISDNKRIQDSSPIAMFIFFIVYIFLTALMEVDIAYVLILVFSFVITQVLFQHTPRYTFLSLKFLMKNSKLTPSFEDKDYIHDEKSIKNLKNILRETE